MVRGGLFSRRKGKWLKTIPQNRYNGDSSNVRSDKMQNNTLSRPGFSLSGTALKRIACLSMLLDHIGASLLENGLFKQGCVLAGGCSAGQRSAAGGAAGLSHLLLSAGGGLPPHPRFQKIRPADAGLRPHQRVALRLGLLLGRLLGASECLFHPPAGAAGHEGSGYIPDAGGDAGARKASSGRQPASSRRRCSIVTTTCWGWPSSSPST